MPGIKGEILVLLFRLKGAKIVLVVLLKLKGAKIKTCVFKFVKII